MSTDIAEIIKRREQQETAKKEKNEKIRKTMKYRAVVNIDFTNSKQTEYQRLVTALIQTGWQYVETSALTYEGSLQNILVAMELISKQCQACGILSALTFHVQGSTNLSGRPYPQSKKYNAALSDIRRKPLPEPLISKN